MEWISVEDKLPEEYQQVLAYYYGDVYVLAYYDGGFKDFDEQGYPDEPFEDISHWMPLPEPPKGE